MAAKFDSLEKLTDDALTTAERSATTAKYLSRFGALGKFAKGPGIPIAVGAVELAKEPTARKAFEVTAGVAGGLFGAALVSPITVPMALTGAGLVPAIAIEAFAAGIGSAAMETGADWVNNKLF